MSYATEQIAETLRKAREQKGLSQRALSARAGVPQSHISKIENNAVDLRTSSLTAIAHALDLELALVPRKAVPAVKSVTRSVGTSPMVDSAIGKEFRKIEKTLKSRSVHPAKVDGLDHLQRNFRDLSQFQNLVRDSEQLRNIRKILESVKSTTDTDAFKRANEVIRAYRNTLAHAESTVDQVRPARSAYRLDGGDDG